MLTLLTSLIFFGKGFQTFGPMNDGADFPLTFFLWGCTKFACSCDPIWLLSNVKNFTHIYWGLLVYKFEYMVTLLKPIEYWEPIYLSKLLCTNVDSVSHSQTETYIFILANLHFIQKFLSQIWVQAETAKSKWGCTIALQSILFKSGIINLCFRHRNFNFPFIFFITSRAIVSPEFFHPVGIPNYTA